MIKVFSLLIFLLASFITFSQETDTTFTTSTDTIHIMVDSAATFPGGKPGWINHVQNHLNPSVGVDNGAHLGTYNVVIKFTVMKDGTLKDFKPETKFGYGFEQEVIRVLKLSPKWVPAKKNGVNVNSVAKQTQTFVISKG
jgi:hypothetical protein